MLRLASVLSLWMVACWLLLPAAASGRENTTRVKFLATGPDGLDIVGETAQIEVTSDAFGLRLLVPLASIHTGIDLRDRQLRDRYLEVQKHPNAELRVARKELQFPVLGGTADGQALGLLTLHGHTKQVRFHYTARRDASGFAVSGTLRVNLRDHEVELPEYLGVKVRPHVEVTVECYVPASVQ